MKKPIFSATVFAVFVAALVASATVIAAVTPKPKLTFFKSAASIGWSDEGGSSPNDPTNAQSIKIVVPGTTGSGAAGAFTYGISEAANSIVGRTLGQVDFLSFDTMNFLGNGAPRISLITMGDDGNHTYFLSAFHCNDTLSGGWVEADFIHDTTSCFIFRDSEIAGYAGWAAVAAVADANHEEIIDWFLIVDEGPSTTYVDRLVAQDFGWVRSGSPGIISCLDTLC